MDALIIRATGEIVLVREEGHPWGRREDGRPGAPLCVVTLEDADLQKRLAALPEPRAGRRGQEPRVLPAPYAKYEAGVEGDRPRRVQLSAKVVPEGKRSHGARVNTRDLMLNPHPAFGHLGESKAFADP